MRAALLTCVVLLLSACSAPPSSSNSPPTFHIVGGGINGASQLTPEAARGASRLQLLCSDPQMSQSFDWAERQAMSYARNSGDPVGPWIEGGEPGRESFCMRDMSHQSMGAHALGLDANIHNMMRRFAENISESRDWCSYWGMTRENQPRRVDFEDDAHFWYCLPANFDVLDCCYRMYLWSGDDSYMTDPVFLNFFDRSMHDYVQRWGLAPNQLPTRPRLLNVRGILDPTDKFQRNRGIPGYNEQAHGYTVEIDLVAKEFTAFCDYAYIEQERGDDDEANWALQQAAAIKQLVNTLFWNQPDQSFYLRLDQNHKPEGVSGPILLDNSLVDDPKRIKAALTGAGPDALYRWGNPDQANAQMIDIALGNKARRDYPEVSFTWIGTFVNGTMGITLEADMPDIAWTKGNWVRTIVRTRSGLGAKIAWAELRHLPIRDNYITVRHDGQTKTTVTNESGPAFIWRPAFLGSHATLLVNGTPVTALVEHDALGRAMSSIRVTVGAGGRVIVQVP